MRGCLTIVRRSRRLTTARVIHLLWLQRASRMLLQRGWPLRERRILWRRRIHHQRALVRRRSVPGDTCSVRGHRHGWSMRATREGHISSARTNRRGRSMNGSVSGIPLTGSNERRWARQSANRFVATMSYDKRPAQQGSERHAGRGRILKSCPRRHSIRSRVSELETQRKLTQDILIIWSKFPPLCGLCGQLGKILTGPRRIEVSAYDITQPINMNSHADSHGSLNCFSRRRGHIGQDLMKHCAIVRDKIGCRKPRCGVWGSRGWFIARRGRRMTYPGVQLLITRLLR
jgi:hypothetical protein